MSSEGAKLSSSSSSSTLVPWQASSARAAILLVTRPPGQCRSAQPVPQSSVVSVQVAHTESMGWLSEGRAARR
eukprot:1932973-Rhodomonas_salina.1